jgi:chemotaxis protein methyltransferase CheR
VTTCELRELTDHEFESISTLVKDLCGINLHQGKKELVKARLSKRLRCLGLTSFQDYIEHLRKDRGDEMIAMLDLLSTNLTSFFREPGHFDFLAELLAAKAASTAQGRARQLRIWSAGCSSGEEPYTIAVIVNENLPDLAAWDAKILATDLSTRVLARAKAGTYRGDQVSKVPGMCLSQYFTCVQSRPERIYKVNESLSRLIRFARLNLMGAWAMRGPFDVIFCRNVMIYFDKPTQSRLIGRFAELLAPGGILFVGHSESLAGVQHNLEYVQPTVYRKP